MTTPISYLTIDFGGTFAKATVVDERGKIYADSLTLRPSRSEGTSEEILGAFWRALPEGIRVRDALIDGKVITVVATEEIMIQERKEMGLAVHKEMIKEGEAILDV